MLMKEKTSKEVSNYALLNSIADSFYTDLIDSIEETDSIVDVRRPGRKDIPKGSKKF